MLFKVVLKSTRKWLTLNCPIGLNLRFCFIKKSTTGLYWNDFDYNDIGFAKYPPKIKNMIRKIIFVLMIRNTLNLAPKTDQKLMSVFEDLHYGRSCLRINVFRRYLVKPTLVQSPKKARRLFIIIIICQHKCIIHSEKENQIYTYNEYTSECYFK